ncbi:MAG: hypothetical protein UV36_C0039G0012, partial [Parcubacteria group bacterium GW2011_GWC2_42_6]
KKMSKVVFDIETVGIDSADLDMDLQNYFFKKEDEKEEVIEKFALWPFTSQIVALSMLNPETGKGKTYFQAPAQSRTEQSSGSEQAPSEEIKPVIEDGMEYQAMAEKEILENFWRDIKNYRQFITFNGRLFDCPYIMLRSAVLKVRPTKNLMPPRYNATEHVDLLEQLTFYGAFRKFSLNCYCKAMKLKSCKTDGMDGSKVGQYFKEKRYQEIARYCAADTRATAELFEQWEKYVKI